MGPIYFKAALIVFGVSVAGSAMAAEPRVNIRAELEIVNRAIIMKRAQTATLRLNAVTTPEVALGLDQPKYKPGQHWSVAVALVSADQARMAEPVVERNPTSYATHLYRFEVKEASGDRTLIAVTRQGGPDQALVTLDSKNRLVNVQNASFIGSFDAFPLSVPRYDMSSAEKIDRMPVLPSGIESVLPTGLHAPQNLESAYHFESEDSLGRPIEVIWRKGDPWPVFMRSPAGTAVLAEEY